MHHRLPVDPYADSVRSRKRIDTKKQQHTIKDSYERGDQRGYSKERKWQT